MKEIFFIVIIVFCVIAIEYLLTDWGMHKYIGKRSSPFILIKGIHEDMMINVDMIIYVKDDKSITRVYYREDDRVNSFGGQQTFIDTLEDIESLFNRIEKL